MSHISGEIGYMAQDVTLFPDTIKNNITMFDPKLNEAVEQICKQIEFEKDLRNFPNGLDTIVNLDKNNLSGGQKQKIALARIKIHDNQFLLIDEGTSAIDSKSTKEILDNLLKSKQTVIMIAHNFSDELKNMFDYQIKLSSNKEVA